MMVHEFCKKEGYCVKYIFQFARITAFCLAGEVLAAVLPLPIPASVYGLLLLAAALITQAPLAVFLLAFALVLLVLLRLDAAYLRSIPVFI